VCAYASYASGAHALVALARKLSSRLCLACLSAPCIDSHSGNKLFQGRFITTIYGQRTLLETLEWTLLNSFIALLGYYAAALTIDKPWMGRWRMQGTFCVRVAPPIPFHKRLPYAVTFLVVCLGSCLLAA
jgi:hypothetical protein